MSEMCLFQRFRYSPPEKTVADYSEPEKEQFRSEFRPIARQHRIFNYVFLIIGIAVFLLLILSKRNDWWLLFLSVLAFGILYSLLFDPVCPACERRVNGRIRTFCPECGGKVSPGGSFKAPQCLSCGMDLWRGKRRSYKIRCCTHCGVFLDGKGI
jgi:hypothetical protein